MRVFLTGGTGLIGSHLAERLRAAGHAVVCLHRPGSDTTVPAALGCELVEGDARDAPELQAERMAGCEAVVHAAALVYGSTSWDEARAANVDATERVLAAAALAGAERAVHVSSVAVYGETRGAVDEDTPL
ncbi:MAG: NAD-dependent epimerase/dehydratase family protein, partial [Gemmatimonadetes bacterium]